MTNKFLEELVKQADPWDTGPRSILLIYNQLSRAMERTGLHPNYLRIHPDQFEKIFNALPQTNIFKKEGLPFGHHYMLMGLIVILDENMMKNHAQLLYGHPVFVISHPQEDTWTCAVCGDVTDKPHEHTQEEPVKDPKK
jgi:hypothetical protein